MFVSSGMVLITALTLGGLLWTGSGTSGETKGNEKGGSVGGIYGFTMKNIDGKEIPLSQYKGKVVMIVNVASRCGNTPQYTALEELYRKYKDRGFAILGFPANNFGGQEPGTDAEIKEFCSTTYDVTFDMFSKISVKGEDQHPLYALLTSGNGNPKLKGDVTWNFQKFLVDRTGKVVAVFTPRTKPNAPELVKAVEEALGEKE